MMNSNRNHNDARQDMLSPDELRQADLSPLTVSQMTPAQRAELRRRYDMFVANFGPAPSTKLGSAKPKSSKPKKWVPQAKAK